MAPLSEIILSKFSSTKEFLCINRDIIVSVFSFFFLISSIDFKELQTFVISLLEGNRRLVLEGAEGGESGSMKLESNKIEPCSFIFC